MPNSVTVTPEVQAAPLVASTSRTIQGRVLPWDEFGRTNQGAITFPKGSISIPTDLSTVKPVSYTHLTLPTIYSV